jgi:Lon protease-like protein
MSPERKQTMERLPLFPLRTVLFPGVALPIHVFEERYRTMIGRCIDERAPFGVALIRSGEEVGGPADPFETGCTASIARVQRLPDGKLNLIVLGERRFRIAALDSSEAYLVGDVEFVESAEVDTPEAREEADRVAALFGEQSRLKMAITGQWSRRLNLPDEPGALADFVAGNMDASPLAKQALLEQLNVPERLRMEADLLGERIRTLNERWERAHREKFTGAALN